MSSTWHELCMEFVFMLPSCSQVKSKHTGGAARALVFGLWLPPFFSPRLLQVLHFCLAIHAIYYYYDQVD